MAWICGLKTYGTKHGTTGVQHLIYTERGSDSKSGDPFNAFEHDFYFTFDDDLRETDVWKSPSRDINNILRGFSYWESFDASDIVLEKDYTCAVLMYDSRYDGRVMQRTDNEAAFEMTKPLHPDIELEFVGVIPYIKE